MSLRTRQAGPLTTLIFGILFVVGGFFAVKHGQKVIDEAKASISWPSVPGTVVASDVSRTRRDNKTKYSAEIVCSYRVGGRAYESNRRRIGASSSSSSSSSAYKIVNQYPKGKSIEVCYNPNSPEEAVLEPGVFFESKILWHIGIVLIVLGVLMAGGILVKILLIGGFLLAKK